MQKEIQRIKRMERDATIEPGEGRDTLCLTRKLVVDVCGVMRKGRTEGGEVVEKEAT